MKQNNTVTKLSEKFCKDVKKVSQDKIQGKVVQKLKILFADVWKIKQRRIDDR